MEEDICSCIIHTSDISKNVSQLKDFTAVTLSKFLSTRKIWLSLTGNLTDVAVKSLEYFPDEDEQAFINEELFLKEACNIVLNAIESLLIK